MAVAIWDHLPEPSELLERRLSNGWRPRATPTVDGNIVLGYASCLVEPAPNWSQDR
ncbi:MAG: hypothetical protein ABI353_20615 [Isosphaeraceae bacterium]